MTGKKDGQKFDTDRYEAIEAFLIDEDDRQPLVRYHPIFAQIAGGDIKAGLLLSQMWYWSGRATKTFDGTTRWFFKTSAEWRQETGLDRRELENARKKLRELRLSEERQTFNPNRIYFRVNFETVMKELLIAGCKIGNWSWTGVDAVRPERKAQEENRRRARRARFGKDPFDEFGENDDDE